MKRPSAVVLALLVVAIAGVVWAAPLPAAADDSVTEQISDAYLNVLNEYVPLRDRVAAIEGGEQLRATLKKFDKLDKVAGFEFRAVKLVVNSVRTHGGDAEVNLAIYLDYSMVTGWSGVARKIDGEWVVARGTVCTLLMEWTPVRCPNGPGRPDYRYRAPAKVQTIDGESVIPVTFADGGRADVFVPKGIEKGWQILPHAEVVLDEGKHVSVWFQPGRVEATQPVRTYRGAPGRVGVVLDAMRGLVVRLGKWTAFVNAEQLSEPERRSIAKHLDGYTTTSGFPVLIPTGPLGFDRPDSASAEGVVLAKSALNIDSAANPMELTISDEDTYYISVMITPGPCPAELQSPVVSGNYHAEERCTASEFGRIAAEGNADYVERAIDELRVENYRPAPRSATPDPAVLGTSPQVVQRAEKPGLSASSPGR